MLTIEKQFSVKNPVIAKAIMQELLLCYNTKDVSKSLEGDKIVIKAILVGPYSL